MKPPLLYLVHRIPFPPNKGDKVRSFNILKSLARRHRVFLGTFVDDPRDRQHIESLREWCEEVCAIDLSPRLAKVQSLSGLVTGEALSLPFYRSPTLFRWVRNTISSQGIRDGVAFSGPMAQYLDLSGLSCRVVDFCDLDSEKWTRYAADCKWPLSWLYRREGARLLAFESEVAAKVDASLFVTQAEAELFKGAMSKRIGEEVSARVRVMQNGVDSDYFSPSHKFENPYSVGKQVLLFTGAMDYWPNVDAVSWFATRILPSIRSCLPNVEFWIVGMNPTSAVLALAGEGVRVTGAVPDVRPYLAHADVVVAPLRIARGIQNKVLEAMAMERAVVLSAEPAIGLGAVSGQECEVADSAEVFAERAITLLQNVERRNSMGRVARGLVLRNYSWSAHLAVLDQLLVSQGDGVEDEVAGKIPEPLYQTELP